MKSTFTIAHADSRRYIAQQVMAAPAGHCVTIAEPTRSLEQNALMWPLLDCLSKQILWYGVRMSGEDWKDMLTASLRKQRSAPGIDGGFVVFGERTKTYSKAQFSELIELIYAFGTQHNVGFTRKGSAQ